jgi:hypothetical protein
MTRSFRWSLRAYRRLLMLYPESLRRDFCAEMLEAFEDDLSAAPGIRGAIRVWRIALQETIRIGLPAWLQNPAVAVPAISAALYLVTQSSLILVVRRATRLNLRPEATPLFATRTTVPCSLDTLFTLALFAALTALTSFVAVHRWKRASLISLDLLSLDVS